MNIKIKIQTKIRYAYPKLKSINITQTFEYPPNIGLNITKPPQGTPNYQELSNGTMNIVKKIVIWEISTWQTTFVNRYMFKIITRQCESIIIMEKIDRKIKTCIIL
jgi:hypothetical protein